MKQTIVSLIILFFFNLAVIGQNSKSVTDVAPQKIDKTIFACGTSMTSSNKIFIKYVVELINKTRPKICYIPTASYDNPLNIIRWYEYCATLNVEPTVLKTFVESDTNQLTFEEQLLECDAIVVEGGSTLNMIAVWKAQGIDTILCKAYDKGIILAGGSAGSLCWFTGGFTDSRPKYLSQMECLGFLNYSNCPHYGHLTRQKLNNDAVLNHKLKDCYASDDLAGLLFVNGVFKKSVSQNKDNNNYFISEKDGKLSVELLPTEIIK